MLSKSQPLKAADSELEANNQSPHIPALPRGSKTHGILGVLVGRAASPHIPQKKRKIYKSSKRKFEFS